MKRDFADRSTLIRRIRVAWVSCGATILVGVAALAPATAQQTQPQGGTNERFITPNFKEVDLGVIVEAVASVTRKTFIVDQRVKANVTVLSNTAMSPEAFYELFLSILQVNNFAAVTSGNTVKIIPAADGRTLPGRDMQEFVSGTSDELVTQVIAIKNVSAATVNQAIRPLIPQYAFMGVVTSGNLLVVTDRAANVNRLMKVIQRIDQVSEDNIEVVALENASASEIVRVVNSLGAPAAQPDGATMAAKVVADDRSNSVLISGEKAQRMRIKALIGYLDTPLKSGGDTQVRYLYYADAEKLAAKLKEQMTGIAAAATGAPAAGAAAAASAQVDRTISVWPDVQNNALVVTAPPKVMRQINLIVDKLDIRRKQVKVEAIVVEMSVEKSAELGFNWIVGPGKENIGVAPLGVFNQNIGGTSIGQIAAAALAVNQGQSKTTVTDPSGGTTTTTNANPALAGAASAIPSGASLGFGRIEATGINFVALLRALRGDGHTNIISTPYVITLDNEEAKIEVAQEVPFVTGQYATTGAQGGVTGNQVNPFQTIQRQKVGTILKITPQISDSGSVMLKIDQQASSLAQGTQGAVDLITNNRTITTKVLVDNGGLIVLGGLLSDGLTEGENRVPILGSIPLIGQLFKTRNSSKKKQELMVFIHPTVLNDSESIATVTNEKYNRLREAQMNYQGGKVTLLHGEKQPSLPPLEEKTRFVDPATAPKETTSHGEVVDARSKTSLPTNPPPVQTTPPPTNAAPPDTTPAPDPNAPGTPPPNR